MSDWYKCISLLKHMSEQNWHIYTRLIPTNTRLIHTYNTETYHHNTWHTRVEWINVWSTFLTSYTNIHATFKTTQKWQKPLGGRKIVEQYYDSSRICSEETATQHYQTNALNTVWTNRRRIEKCQSSSIQTENDELQSTQTREQIERVITSCDIWRMT